MLRNAGTAACEIWTRVVGGPSKQASRNTGLYENSILPEEYRCVHARNTIFTVIKCCTCAYVHLNLSCEY